MFFPITIIGDALGRSRIAADTADLSLRAKRAASYVYVVIALIVWASWTATSAIAQSTTAPARFDIQAPGARIFGLIGVSSRNDYRDRILSGEPVVFASGGVAYHGFAVSGWAAAEIETGASMHEILIGYSYKLPLIDAHIGYVHCSNERMRRGCPDGIRISATTNRIPHTLIEGSVDLPLGSSRRTYAASLTHNLLRWRTTTVAVRAGWTSTDEGRGSFSGISTRVIVAKRLSRNFQVSAAAGHYWTYGEARPPSARDGFAGSINWTLRF